MQVSIEVDGDVAIAHEFEHKAAALGGEAFAVTRQFGQVLRTSVLAHASGRPGPRHVTGDYKRTWSAVTYVRGLSEVVAEVGTNAPQGPRLEFGFTGTDAIGRHYDQPPYPHARPALYTVQEPFYAAMAKVATL